MAKWYRRDWEALAFGVVYVGVNLAIIAWFARRSFELGAFAIFGLAP